MWKHCQIKPKVCLSRICFPAPLFPLSLSFRFGFSFSNKSGKFVFLGKVKIKNAKKILDTKEYPLMHLSPKKTSQKISLPEMKLFSLVRLWGGAAVVVVAVAFISVRFEFIYFLQPRCFFSFCFVCLCY